MMLAPSPPGRTLPVNVPKESYEFSVGVSAFGRCRQWTGLDCWRATSLVRRSPHGKRRDARCGKSEARMDLPGILLAAEGETVGAAGLAQVFQEAMVPMKAGRS